MMTNYTGESLLTEKQVSDILGLRPRTLQQWRLFGRGPKCVKLSERIVRYRMSDIREWIALIEERRKAEKLS